MSNEYDFDYFEEKILEQELLKLEKQNETLDRYLNYVSKMEEKSRAEVLLLKEQIPKDVAEHIDNEVEEFEKNNAQAIKEIEKKHFKNIDLNNTKASVEILNNYLHDIKTLFKNNVEIKW